MFRYKSLKEGHDDTTVQFEPRASTSRGLTRKELMIGGIILLIIIVVVLAVALGVGYKQREPAVVVMKYPTVTVDCGPIEGRKVNGTYTFLGIPYAANPERWKPPQPQVKRKEWNNQCWNDKHVAENFGDKCIQYSLKEDEPVGNEDCLYVNVWTPTLQDNAKLNVMVWFHDGRLLYGSGHDTVGSASHNIAKELQMVFVTFNYRLNVFGFLALEQLVIENNVTNSSGNYGLLDQIRALEWIKDNIYKFGGDPDRVTVFGEGAGATSIYTLLGSEKAQGLFHKAWLSGLSVNVNLTLQEAQKTNDEFLVNIGCKQTPDVLHCLRKNTSVEILKAYPEKNFLHWGAPQINGLPTQNENIPGLIVIDGDLVKQSPLELWKNNKTVIDVPILLGNEAQEVDDYPPSPDIRHWNKTQYVNYVNEKLNSFGSNITREALDHYKVNKDDEIEKQLTSMITDVRAICPVDEAFKTASQIMKSPIYRYVTLSNPDQIQEEFFKLRRENRHFMKYLPKYSFHRWSVYGFLGFPQKLVLHSKSDEAFKRTIKKVVTSFVLRNKTHNFRWEKFPQKTAVIVSNYGGNIFREQYRKAECKFWRENGFYPKYAWKN